METKKLGRLTLIVVVSVVASGFITGLIMRGCFEDGNSSRFKTIACGNIGQYKGPFFWLEPENFRLAYAPATDHPDPSYQAKNIIDGSSITVTGPLHNNKMDYIIELADSYEIKKIELVWKDYGFSKNVQNWSLLALTAPDNWRIIASGNQSPNEEITLIKTSINTEALRLQAGPPINSLGIYEIKIFGRPDF